MLKGTKMQIGMVIAVDALGGFVRHPGIVSGYTNSGVPLVTSNSLRHGRVVEEPLSDFLLGSPPLVVGSVGTLDPLTIVARARSRLGEPWDLFRFNCEHFVRYACGVSMHSPQLKFASLIVLLAVGLPLLARSR